MESLNGSEKAGVTTSVQEAQWVLRAQCDDRDALELLLHSVQEVNMDGILPASRAVLVLHFEEELSLQEVAAILEIPLGTVKSRLAYCLTALRKQLVKTRRV